MKHNPRNAGAKKKYCPEVETTKIYLLIPTETKLKVIAAVNSIVEPYKNK
jgi:hypothetical protein